MTIPTVSLIEGDGIGPEITAATLASIERTRLALTAARLRAGIAAALASPESRTGDLGGRASTAQYTDAVIRAMP